MKVIEEKYLSNVKIPTNNSRIYKDECILCYETPKSEGGLNICLNTFLGFCSKHLPLHIKKTKNLL
jgi:ubiquitin carboxyl-terminal hydrolase 5/13